MPLHLLVGAGSDSIPIQLPADAERHVRRVRVTGLSGRFDCVITELA